MPRLWRYNALFSIQPKNVPFAYHILFGTVVTCFLKYIYPRFWKYGNIWNRKAEMEKNKVKWGKIKRYGSKSTIF